MRETRWNLVPGSGTRRRLDLVYATVLSRHGDGRAGATVLAVPAMPVEKDEMVRRASVDFLYDAIEHLDRCASPALPLRIQLTDLDPHLRLGTFD